MRFVMITVVAFIAGALLASGLTLMLTGEPESQAPGQDHAHTEEGADEADPPQQRRAFESDALIDRAAQTIAQSLPALPEGSTSLHGRALLANGNPLANCRVSVLVQLKQPEPRQPMPALPSDASARERLSLAMRKSARLAAWREACTFEATTNADGFYEISALPGRIQSVQANHAGYVLAALGSVAPLTRDAYSLDFVAHETLEITLSLRAKADAGFGEQPRFRVWCERLHELKSGIPGASSQGIRQAVMAACELISQEGTTLRVRVPRSISRLGVATAYEGIEAESEWLALDLRSPAPRGAGQAATSYELAVKPVCFVELSLALSNDWELTHRASVRACWVAAEEQPATGDLFLHLDVVSMDLPEGLDGDESQRLLPTEVDVGNWLVVFDPLSYMVLGAKPAEPKAGGQPIQITLDPSTLPGWRLRFSSEHGKALRDVYSLRLLQGDRVVNLLPAFSNAKGEMIAMPQSRSSGLRQVDRSQEGLVLEVESMAYGRQLWSIDDPSTDVINVRLENPVDMTLKLLIGKHADRAFTIELEPLDGESGYRRTASFVTAAEGSTSIQVSLIGVVPARYRGSVYRQMRDHDPPVAMQPRLAMLKASRRNCGWSACYWKYQARTGCTRLRYRRSTGRKTERFRSAAARRRDHRADQRRIGRESSGRDPSRMRAGW